MILRKSLTALALATTFLLTACSAGEKAAEDAIEKAAKENGEDVDVDLDPENGKVEISGEDGTIQAGTDELPKRFPVAREDLVEGVIAASGKAQGGFSVTIESSESVEDAAKLLEKAGYESTESGAPEVAVLTGDKYQVIIQQVGPTLGYTFAKK